LCSIQKHAVINIDHASGVRCKTSKGHLEAFQWEELTERAKLLNKLLAKSSKQRRLTDDARIADAENPASATLTGSLWVSAATLLVHHR
jgi:hypothetical protein